MTLRMYIYVSSSKVATFFPQVPESSAVDICAKLGFDLKVLNGSIETKRQAGVLPKDEISRCGVVEEHLRREIKTFGTPFSKHLWISGKMKGRCVVIPKSDAVIFYAQDQSNFLALGGAASNLVGATPPSQGAMSVTFGPRLLEVLKGMAERDVLLELTGGVPAPNAKGVYSPQSLAARSQVGITKSTNPAWIRTLYDIGDKNEDLPLQTFEFLAVKLFEPAVGTDDICYMLYTPLWVALA